MIENTTQKDTKQFITWVLLILCCVLLSAILVVLNKNNQDREYRFFKGEESSAGGFYIFDSKSGQVWYRSIVSDGKGKTVVGQINYGTPTNPSFHLFGMQPKLVNRASGEKTAWEKDLIRLSDVPE